MKLTSSRALPWHDWFAWRPVQDWDTGQWFWLETVKRKFRVDGAGARWYYKPIPTAEEIAAARQRELERAAMLDKIARGGRRVVEPKANFEA